MHAMPERPAGKGEAAVSAGAGPLRLLVAVLEALFFLAYPFVVYLAHTRLETRSIGVVMIALLVVALVVRLRGSLREAAGLIGQHVGIGVMIGVAIVLDERAVLLFLPALVGVYLLVTFGWTLRRGPPMIERFARIIEDDLPDFTLPYCRRITELWCVFFALHVIVVCTLALMAPLSWWAAYSGALFYVFLGTFLGGEFLFRKLWFRFYGDGPADVILARLFPADRTVRGRRSLAYDARRVEEQRGSED
jgi:uncharacterized membrane protein